MRSPFSWQALFLVALFLPANAAAKPSCGKGGPTGQGISNTGAGKFRYSVPSGYAPSKAMPVLLALHGDEGTSDYIYSVFRGLQNDTGGAFILIAPKAPFGGGSWYKATSSHYTFINNVISWTLSKYNIDQDRLWITGWSGGATFLGYYAPKRQDILAAVIYHMGAGGVGSYSPPPASCKVPARFVIGSNDFLYKLASSHYSLLKGQGHQVDWIELKGVGHSFQKSTLPATWSWLKGKSLCGKTTPGSCGQPPASPKPDSGPPMPLPPLDSGAPPGADGPQGQVPDQLILHREAGASAASPELELTGGCAVSGGEEGGWLWLAAVIMAVIVRRRREGAETLPM